MLNWKISRIICLLLLALPVVHLAYKMSRDALASMHASPEIWADEVAAFAMADRKHPPPNAAIEIVGGHRVRLWRELDRVLAPNPVIMRGLGNATLEDILYYYPELIGQYFPQTLVILPGDAEFHIRDNKDADELVQSIQRLAARDADFRGAGRVFVFSPLKTPLRPQDAQKIDQATDMLLAWAEENPRVTILDANTLLLLPNGEPDPGYFRFDGVNLNERGYLRLSLLLKSALEAERTAAES